MKFRQYEFKKIFLDETIFSECDQECKIGYLNINGLKEGNHIKYFNEDKNI